MSQHIMNINTRYQSILSAYGIPAEIVPVSGDAPKQEITEQNGIYRIRLNTDQIADSDYEDYLAYNVRKLVLPRLRLETVRLRIRRYQKKDAEDVFEALHDRSCCYMDGGYEPYAKNAAYFEMMDGFASDESRFVIAMKDTDTAIGMIHLMPCDNRVVECLEIGYILNPVSQRKGYAFEALSKLLSCLLEQLHLDMVVASAIAENTPSLKLMQKLGFVYEGNIHNAFYHPEWGKLDMLSFYRERVDFSACKLVSLTESTANAISEWTYAPPYDVYNFKGHPNEYLLDAGTWGTEQFALMQGEMLLGQVACQLWEGTLWVGWSLHPAFCGQGGGSRFVETCVAEIRRVTGHTGAVALRVAASNQRAIRAYQKAGFIHTETIEDEIAYTNHPEDFWVMEKQGVRL